MVLVYLLGMQEAELGLHIPSSNRGQTGCLYCICHIAFMSRAANILQSLVLLNNIKILILVGEQEEPMCF